MKSEPLDDEEVARLKSTAAWIQEAYGSYDYPCPNCGFNSEDASRLVYFAALALRLLPEEDR